jgi:hypothetical protein
VLVAECLINGPSGSYAIVDVLCHAVLRVGLAVPARRPADVARRARVRRPAPRPIVRPLELLDPTLAGPGYYLPLCFVCWRANRRLDAKGSGFRPDPHDPGRTKEEHAVAADIFRSASTAHSRTPRLADVSVMQKRRNSQWRRVDGLEGRTLIQEVVPCTLEAHKAAEVDGRELDAQAKELVPHRLERLEMGRVDGCEGRALWHAAVPPHAAGTLGR